MSVGVSIRIGSNILLYNDVSHGDTNHGWDCASRSAFVHSSFHGKTFQTENNTVI